VNGRLPPSPRRLREARARGEVAYAPSLTMAAALGAGALALVLTARPAASRVTALARVAWSGGVDATAAVRELVPTLAATALPIALAALAGALAAGLAQTGFLFAPGALGQRRDEPEPLPATSLAAAAALVLVALAGGRTLVASLARADSWAAAATVTATALGNLAPRAIAVVALGGLAEWVWRRAAFTTALSMTRAEAERERREDEGDPRLRAEQRRRQRALARDPLVEQVARAQLVVTAEAIAVGLRLDRGAARVAAAGDERLLAQRVTDVARRLGIPVRADDELALALAHLPAGAPVPPAWQPRAQAALRAVRR
jgi:flagellar biosynthesis protein FlhB